MSINNVTISGNLTRDPEIKETPSGLAIVNFSVAVNDRRNVDGEWKDYANFIPCVWFGNRAKAFAAYMQKGTHVMLTGKLHWSKWETEGQTRSKIEIIVADLESTRRNAPEKKQEANEEYTEIPYSDCPF